MSLKIPKGQSESVYRRRTENTMAKRKSTKGQTAINDIHLGSDLCMAKILCLYTFYFKKIYSQYCHKEKRYC